jgi:hypothetical protein
MTNEDREKLCADLRDPWARTPEELAELAGVAAGEIERLAQELERERDTAPASARAMVGAIEAREGAK